MADGSKRAVTFLANGGTAVRFRNIFHKELLGSITSIVTSVGTDRLAELLRASQNAGGDDIALNKLSPEALQTVIAIAGSGELETVSKLAYVMNRAAEGADMNALDVEGYLDWLEKFESMEFLTHAMDIIGIYMSNRMTTSSPKK